MLDWLIVRPLSTISNLVDMLQGEYREDSVEPVLSEGSVPMLTSEILNKLRCTHNCVAGARYLWVER